MLLATILLLMPPAPPGTGDVRGRVHDERCQPKPNVFVRAGITSTTSTHTGYYTLELAVGAHTITYEAPGYETEVRHVTVGAQAFTPLDVQLRLRGTRAPLTDCQAVAEAITVTATTPIADTRTPTSVITLNNADVPEEQRPALGTTHNVFINGARITEVPASLPPSAAIERVQQVIGAQPPDAPGPTILHLEQRTGTNEYRGHLQGSIGPRAWQPTARTVAVPHRTHGTRSEQRLEAALGGPLIRDRLWFFTSYEQENSTIEHAAAYQHQDATTAEHNPISAAINLSLAPTLNSHSTIQVWGRHDAWTGILGDFAGRIYGTRSATTRQTSRRTTNVLATHSYARATSMILARAGYTRHTGHENGIDLIQYRSLDENLFATGGSGYLEQDRSVTHWSAGIDAHAIAVFAGEHRMSAGARYERDSDELRDHLTGEQLVDATEDIFLHRFHKGGRARQTHAAAAAIYANDQWSIGQFIMNLGGRWDAQRITADRNATADVAQPRFSIVWAPSDVANAYLSFSRYAHPLTRDARYGLFSERILQTTANFDPIARHTDPAAAARVMTLLGAYRGLAEVDESPTMAATNEWTIGGSVQTSHTAVEARAIRRRLYKVIDDVLCTTSRERCVGTPGQGRLGQILTSDGHLVPTPMPRRDQDSIDLRATTRHPSWRGSIAYLWSREYGNMTSHGQAPADPLSTTTYDILEFLQPRDGPAYGALPSERRHRLTASAIIDDSARRLRYSLEAYWAAGYPRSRYGYSDLYGEHLILLAPRGTDGRSPNVYEAHARIEHTIPLGDARMTIGVAVRNLLNAQRPVSIDERWSFRQRDNNSSTPTNATFGQPIIRTGPRQILVIGRLAF